MSFSSADISSLTEYSSCRSDTTERWMLLSRAPRGTFSAYIFQSGRPPVWIRSNLYFVRTISCTHTERFVVMAADRPDVVVLAVYVGACYSHVLTSPDLLLLLWSHGSSTGGSLCEVSHWETLVSGFRRPLVVFLLLFSLHQHRQVLRMRQEGDRWG